MPDDPLNPPPRQHQPRGGQDKLELSIALSENENTRAVLDGRIAPEGIRLHADPDASVRDVLAATEIRRVRRLRNVDVVDDDRDLAGPDAVGDDPGVHHARVLPPAHPRPRRRRHQGAGGPQGQARRRAGVSADRGAVEPRRAAARVRRACARHRMAHGAHARGQPRRRHRVQAAGRRHGASHPGQHQHRRDDGEGRARRHPALSHARQHRRPQPHRAHRRQGLSPAVRPQGGGRALFQKNRHLPDQPRHGDPPLDATSAIHGRRSTSSTPSPRRAPRCCAPATPRCTATTSRA